jgi:hypothetical protein
MKAPSCYFSLKFFSIALIISPAISLLVAPSIPSNPGHYFNSKGPLAERIISTPATFKSMLLPL